MMSRRTLVLVMFVMSMVTATAVETHRRRMKFGADGDRCTGSFSHAHILPTLSTQKFMAYRGVCRTIADCKASDPKKGEDFNKISRTGNCGSGLKCCYKSGGEVKFVGSEKGVYKSTTQSVSRSTQQLRRVQRAMPSKKTRRRERRAEDDEFDLESQLLAIDGLEKVKDELRALKASYLLDAERRELGIPVLDPPAPHMVFVGNPGTGKTTIAKMLGKLLLSIGAVETDNVVLATRADLVGAFIGATEKKTMEKVEEARGGVLFIDEAYQLYKEDSSKDFGHEAIETIMNVLHDNDPVIIFAGYPNEMKSFMNANPGLRRRVGRTFLFEDYEFEHIAKIFVNKNMKQAGGYKIKNDEGEGNLSSEEAAMWLAGQMKSIIDDRQRRMFNVGLADNLMDRVRQIQNRRLMTTLYGTPEEDLDGEGGTPNPTSEEKKQLLLQFTEKDLTSALTAIKNAFDASMEDDDDEEDPGKAQEPKDLMHGDGAPTYSGGHSPASDYDMISNLAAALQRVLAGGRPKSASSRRSRSPSERMSSLDMDEEEGGDR
eukprot:g4955.t1